MSKTSNNSSSTQPNISNPFIFTLERLRDSSAALILQVSAKIQSSEEFSVATESAQLLGMAVHQVGALESIICGDSDGDGTNEFFAILSFYIAAGELVNDKFFFSLGREISSFMTQDIDQDYILSGECQGSALKEILVSFGEIVRGEGSEPAAAAFAKIFYFLANFLQKSLLEDISLFDVIDDEGEEITEHNDSSYTEEELTRIIQVSGDNFETVFEGVIEGGISFRDTFFEASDTEGLEPAVPVAAIKALAYGIIAEFDEESGASDPRSLLSLMTIYITVGLINNKDFVDEITEKLMSENALNPKNLFKEDYKLQSINKLIESLKDTFDGEPFELDIMAFGGVLAGAVLELCNKTEEELDDEINGFDFDDEEADSKTNIEPRHISCYDGPQNSMRLRFFIDQSIKDEPSETSISIAEKIVSDFYNVKTCAGESDDVGDFNVNGSFATLAHIQQVLIPAGKLDPRHYYFVM